MADKDESTAKGAVLVSSDAMPESAIRVAGVEFTDYDARQSTGGPGITVREMLKSMSSMGFQATNLGRAVEVVEDMINWRPTAEDLADGATPEDRTTIFLGYTSNLVSSGVRESIRYLVQHKKVHAICATAGGIEEDLIKCLAPTYLGAFNLDGADLRRRGLNRIGNLLVPNDNYCKFEDWVVPIFDKMLQEQQEEGRIWTPSTMIDRLGREINDESSILYWAHKNQIPIFCPALTDGSLGDMLYFHSFKSDESLIVDINRDIRKINTIAVRARKTGVIILGGGLVKHHICNANLMRNGSDFAVYINTGQEFDGSDAGASVTEAISWGKIRADAQMVKVHADASIIFPLLVASTFAHSK